VKKLSLLFVAGLALAGCDNNMNSTPSAPTNPNPPTTNTTPATDHSVAPPANTSPDNTGVNTRDRNGDTKTPIDQNENSADVKMTADIRMKIVNQEGMSINARNVKIVTQDGKVTLRGPVESDDEKKTIEGFAKNVAGDGNVDNQLEVKPSDK
jgi:osmotically-inducible protein OsmY